MSLLVVMGMHRSGTSALAGVITRLGYNAGKNTLPANQFNSRGYFEDVRLNAALDQILKVMGFRWDDERILSNDLFNNNTSVAASRYISDIFDEEFNFGVPTVIKDPRVCRLLPLFKTVWHERGLSPKYIFTLRCPYAVISSLSMRDAISPQRAALLYVAYLMDAEKHTRGSPRIFVEYEDLLKDWRISVAEMRLSLGVDLPVENIDVALSASDIDSFLSIELNHYVEGSPKPKGFAIDLALEVFSLLKGTRDGVTWASLDALRDRWQAYLCSLDPWLSDTAELNKLRDEIPSALISPGPAWIRNASLHAESVIYLATASQDFTEACKVITYWSFGQLVEQRYRMPLLVEAPVALRWDITDRPSFCLVNDLCIKNSQGVVQWVWSPGADLLETVSADMHLLGLNQGNQFQIMATGFDPFGILSIPKNILNQIREGWEVCIKWMPIIPAQALSTIMTLISSSRKKLYETDVKLSTIERENLALLDQVKLLGRDLEQLRLLERKTREEISRAQAQLNLIKDIWLENKELDSF